MTVYVYGAAGWLLIIGCVGMARSRHLVQAISALSVAQSGTYVLFVGIGYQHAALAPVFSSSNAPGSPVVDPVVQAMVLTDIVVAATVTALLLALTVQIAKRHGTLDPDQLRELKG
jgi:multicomponent Na+:H+ antiporter subunit C